MAAPDLQLRPDPHTVAASVGPTRSERQSAVQRARLLNVTTIGWNTVEGVVAIAAGVAAGSVSLVGFGIDSAIEVSAAVILAWRLHLERNGGCMQLADAKARKAIAASFAALAIYVAYDAVGDLIEGTVLGSAAAKADAAQTNLCALLSAVVLVGVGANWTAGWWWADPAAGLGIAVIAGAEAVRTWRADSLDDTCCA
jgi:divalent metal cation (Fe/Co/Zn/Cd) transporter